MFWMFSLVNTFKAQYTKIIYNFDYLCVQN